LTELEYEVRLEVSIASRSLMINGSASGLLQVLTELVDNATYALQNDAVKDGVIGLSLSESDVGRVVLKLRDNGRGVSEAYRHTIFEPFFTTKGHSGHLGLGLTRSRDLIRAMSGEITVNTALTAPGFEVVIEFPMALTS
jgi:C4-dicarboxylate-specific signal transduction histidine kinase